MSILHRRRCAQNVYLMSVVAFPRHIFSTQYGLLKSDVYYMHCLLYAHNGQLTSDVEWNNNLWPSTSFVTNTHKSSDMDVDCQYLPWHTHQFVDVGQWQAHQSRPEHIRYGFYVSVRRYFHQQISRNINPEILTSSKGRWPTISSISQGVHAYVVACAHRCVNINIRKWHEESSVICVLLSRGIG